jgi:kynurenine formamidase
MWHYEPPFPEIRENFVGMGSQTGTYLSTAGHYFKDEKKIDDIPLEKLFMVDVVVLNLPRAKDPKEPIQLDEISALKPVIHEGVVILFGAR